MSRLLAAVVVIAAVGLVAPLGFATVAGAADAAAGMKAPQRIVSINLCTDQLLVDLVAPDRIAGLSRLAADPVLSAIADRIGGLRLLHGHAEEVLSLSPDLVLTSEYSTPHVVSLLRRVGMNVVVVPMAGDIDAIRKSIRLVAESVGETARGQAVIAQFDLRLRAAEPRSPFRPTALAYQVNSLTAGPGGLLDAALGAAGFRNVASERPLGPAGRLPLETFVTHPPDLVVLANAPDAFRTVMADNLRHRAFRETLARRRHVDIPMPLWLCGTPAIAQAVERLGAERSLLMQAAVSDEHDPAAPVVDGGVSR